MYICNNLVIIFVGEWKGEVGEIDFHSYYLLCAVKSYTCCKDRANQKSVKLFGGKLEPKY